MRQVKPTGDFLVPVIYSGHEAHAKVSDFAKGAGLAQLATDAAGNVTGIGSARGLAAFESRLEKSGAVLTGTTDDSGAATGRLNG